MQIQEFYVYVLKSLRNQKRYVGSTRISPQERLKQHNYGCNQWTKENRPFELIYHEEYQTMTEARKREIFLKSGIGRKFLNQILVQKIESSASAKGGSASGGG